MHSLQQKHICISNVILQLECSFEQILQWTINNTRIFKSKLSSALYFINKQFTHVVGKKSLHTLTLLFTEGAQKLQCSTAHH